MIQVVGVRLTNSLLPQMNEAAGAASETADKASDKAGSAAEQTKQKAGATLAVPVTPFGKQGQ